MPDGQVRLAGIFAFWEFDWTGSYLSADYPAQLKREESLEIQWL